MYGIRLVQNLLTDFGDQFHENCILRQNGFSKSYFEQFKYKLPFWWKSQLLTKMIIVLINCVKLIWSIGVWAPSGDLISKPGFEVHTMTLQWSHLHKHDVNLFWGWGRTALKMKGIFIYFERQPLDWLNKLYSHSGKWVPCCALRRCPIWKIQERGPHSNNIILWLFIVISFTSKVRDNCGGLLSESR